MTDDASTASSQDGTTFTWHENYRGRTSDDVIRELAGEIANDQRAHELALSGAEQEEHAALASVMELEKRWSEYSFDWADMPPEELARRIVDFELERDRRQQMISWEQYRAEVAPPDAAPAGWRASLSDEDRRRYANCGAILIIGLIIVIILILMAIL